MEMELNTALDAGACFCLLDHDFVVWLGDLNYRIDVEDGKGPPKVIRRGSADISARTPNLLLDSLGHDMRGLLFPGLMPVPWSPARSLHVHHDLKERCSQRAGVAAPFHLALYASHLAALA